MTPAGNRAYQYSYRVRIEKETTPALQEMAAELGFISDAPGYRQGSPSPGAFLDALATAYRRDPGGVHLAFKVLGITPDGRPTYTSDNPPQPAHE